MAELLCMHGVRLDCPCDSCGNIDGFILHMGGAGSRLIRGDIVEQVQREHDEGLELDRMLASAGLRRVRTGGGG